jgi:predicted secreted protein
LNCYDKTAGCKLFLFGEGVSRMSIAMAIFTFLNVWCITLFATLPMYIIRGRHENPTEYEAAPKHIYWRRLFITNSCIALGLTATIALIIKTGIVPVR